MILNLQGNGKVGGILLQSILHISYTNCSRLATGGGQKEMWAGGNWIRTVTHSVDRHERLTDMVG